MSSSAPLTTLAALIRSAAHENRCKDLQHLLDEWKSANVEPLQPALVAAFRQGHVGPANLLLSRGCECGFDATGAALSGGHIPIFECMVQHGWDVNYCLDHRGDVLISTLRFYPTMDLSRWLLEHGADPNCNSGSDPLGSTALDAACSRKQVPPEMVSLLLQHGAKVNFAMLIAAWKGNVEALRVLLDESGAFDIDAIPGPCGTEWDQEERWGTALHAAASQGEMDCVRFLLDRGARRDIRNAAGRTPIETAEHFEQLECVAALKELPE